MPITRRFTVYTNAGVSVPPVIHVNQYDRGETWIFTLLEPDGSKYSPASGGIVGIKADGHAIINTATVNSNGEVVVSETQQMTAAAGKAVYEIIFDNSTHGTANFIVCVEPKPGDNATLSDSDLSLIQEAIDSTIPANIEASVQDWMDDNLAPAEWVIDNTLSIAGAAADAKKVGDVTSELKTALFKSTGFKEIPVTATGKYIATSGTTADINSPVDDARFIYSVVEASEGDKFTINATGGSTPRAWAFINSSGTVLAVADNGAVCNDLVIIAPENSAYLIINSKEDTRKSYYGANISGLLYQIEDTVKSNLKDCAFNVKNEYVNSAGHVTATANWIAYYLRATDVLKITSVKTYSSSAGVNFYQVAFFNSFEPSESTFISGNGVQFTAEGWNENIDIDVPSTAVLCIVTGRTDSDSDSTAEGLYKIASLIDDIKDSTIHHVTPDAFIEILQNIQDVTVTTDTYTGQKVANMTGTSAVKIWASVNVECEQAKAYVIEFFGKTNDDSWNSGLTNGAYLTVTFFNASGAQIGNNYRAYVMGTQKLKYHRYGFVSPYGTSSAKIAFVTRPNCDMHISNIKFDPVAIVPQKMRTGILLDGHLGMTYIAPKNTMPSFELGKIAGFNTMITNINVTQDGVLVALHDNTIDATSDGTGNVTDYTYNQLLSYDFGSWFNASYTGTKIPKFEEVVAFLANAGIRLGVSLHHNLTNAQLAEMCDIIKKYYTTQILIKSFYLEDLQYVYSELGDLAEYMWDGTPNNGNADLASIQAFPVTFEISASFTDDDAATDAFVAYARSKGLKLSCYYGDNVITLKHLAEKGINRFTVNTFSDIVFPME